MRRQLGGRFIRLHREFRLARLRQEESHDQMHRDLDQGGRQPSFDPHFDKGNIVGLLERQCMAGPCLGNRPINCTTFKTKCGRGSREPSAGCRAQASAVSAACSHAPLNSLLHRYLRWPGRGAIWSACLRCPARWLVYTCRGRDTARSIFASSTRRWSGRTSGPSPWSGAAIYPLRQNPLEQAAHFEAERMDYSAASPLTFLNWSISVRTASMAWRYSASSPA